MKKIIIVLSLFYLLSSCAEESILETDKTPQSEEKEETKEPVFVEDGIMNFASLETLDDFLLDIEEQLIALEEDQSNARTLTQINLPEGFLPLAKSYNRSSSNGNARTLEGEETEEDVSAEIEEVINENLIPNEALHYVLDSARRLKIAENIYQVTEAGTFIYLKTHTAEFENLYENFLDEYLNYSEQLDSITYRYENILFKDSYGYVSRQDLTEEKVVDFISGNFETFDDGDDLEEIPSNARTNSGNTSVYGLRTVSKPKTNRIGIFNVRSAMFDSNHRVAVSLDEFRVNLGFAGASYSNFKVKFQYRKKVRACYRIFRRRRCRTLFSYWVKRTAHDMVIGKEEMELEVTYPFGFEGGDYYDTHNQFSNKVGNIVSTLTYNGISNIDFVSGWSDRIRLFGADVKIAGISAPVGKTAWDQGTKLLKDQLKKGTTNFVKTHTGHDADAAKMMVSQFGTKEYYYLDGLGRYRYKKDKKVSFLRFGGGAGIKLSNDGKVKLGQYRNTKLKIVSGNIFGAVKYNGRWRGVRIRG